MSEEVIRRCDFRIRKGRERKECNAVVEKNEATLFSFDNAAYSVDLCAACKMRARDELTIVELIQISRPEFAKIGREVRRLIRGRSGDVTTAKIREWAQKEGLDVAASGMLSKKVKAAYEQAHA